VIDWVMKSEGVSFRHAVELLREGIPSLAVQAASASAPRRPPKKSTVQRLGVVGAGGAEAEAEELLRDVVEYYHATLKESPAALGYLEQRGIRNEAAIEKFRLGYANRTLGYRIPNKQRQAGMLLRKRYEELGIYRQSGHEHLSGSLVIPVFDEQGRVVEMYGRKITPNLRKGTPLHLYLPGPHRGVWNGSELGTAEEIILCESLIDALTFWCAGFRNVTAAYGIEGFTGDHREAIRRSAAARVLIAYDRDEAGERAAAKLAPELSELGKEVFRIWFPQGQDANEHATGAQSASEALELVIRQASWMAGTRRSSKCVVATEREAAPELEPAEPPGAPEPSAPSEPTEALLSLAAPPDPDPEPAPPAPRPREPSGGDELQYCFGDRRWRVRGLGKNKTPGILRLNLLVSREGAGFHVDTLELYSARQRGVFVKLGAEELGVEESVIKRDLGELLLRLEQRQEEAARAVMAPTVPEMTAPERAAALELLRAPDLATRIVEDLGKCGVVGEETNKLVAYLAATSRKLERPLAVVIQSASAAGKSSLMEAILQVMPEEERIAYSAMTGQSLFYMGETDLAHKILAIAEEEGAERAAYALKLLQSEGELRIASTGKDPATGRLVTEEYHVQGPVMIFLTTTAVDVDEELLNRCLVLSVDEGRQQTRAIHDLQREEQTLEGMLARQERAALLRLHQNVQRLLRPLRVVNPFARELRFVDHQTRTRRDHMKYLALIQAIALCHQYQRPVKTAEHRGERLSYVEVIPSDIALANRLCHEVLGRTLDELPPGTRRLLGELEQMVAVEAAKLGMERADYHFSRREVRQRTQLSNTQLKVHLARLVEMEYLLVHRGRQGQGFVYELAYAGEGQNGERFLPGLLEVATATTETSRGSEPDFAGAGRPPVGARSGGGRSAEEQPKQQETSSNRESVRETARRTRSGASRESAVVDRVSSLAASAALAAGA
jgi:DNA primase